MGDIYAVAVSASQSIDGPSARAELLHSNGGRKTVLTLEWKLPHAINADGQPGEWLYAVLSRIVQDFDDHQVVRAEYDRFQTTQEGTNE